MLGNLRCIACRRVELFVSFALGAATNVMVYVVIVYVPIYAVQTLRLAVNTPFLVLAVTLPVRMLLLPYFGYLSDRYSRRSVMGVALVLFTLSVYPGFLWLIHSPGLVSLMTVELVFAVLMAAVLGPFAAAMAELFPTNIRSTGMSLTYNLTASLLGGFSPFILTWLVAVTGDSLVPAHYLVLSLALGAVSLLFMRTRFGADASSRVSLPDNQANAGSLRTVGAGAGGDAGFGGQGP